MDLGFIFQPWRLPLHRNWWCNHFKSIQLSSLRIVFRHTQPHVETENEDRHSSWLTLSIRTPPFSLSDLSVTTGTQTADCSCLHVILQTVEPAHALICSSQEGVPNLFNRKIHRCTLNSSMTFVQYVNVAKQVLKPPRQTKVVFFLKHTESRCVKVCEGICLHGACMLTSYWLFVKFLNVDSTDPASIFPCYRCN